MKFEFTFSIVTSLRLQLTGPPQFMTTALTKITTINKSNLKSYLCSGKLFLTTLNSCEGLVWEFDKIRYILAYLTTPYQRSNLIFFLP